MSSVGLYPVEKEVARRIYEDEGFGYGAEIPMDLLCEMLEVNPPKGEFSREVWEAYTLHRMSKIESLKSILLSDYLMLLVNIRGVGYRVVMPEEQTGISMESFKSRSSLLVNRTKSRLQCLDTSELDDAAIKENITALANVAAIEVMMARQLSLEGVTSKKLGKPGKGIGS